MVPFCKDQKYCTDTVQPAGFRPPWQKKPSELSKRLQEDTYAKGKYDATKEKDAIIIDRSVNLQRRRG